jgi:uncharacterized protein
MIAPLNGAATVIQPLDFARSPPAESARQPMAEDFSHLRKQTTGKEYIMIRDTIKAAQVASMKAGDKPRLAAVRLILAKIKDRDIELRTAASVPDDDVMVVDVLQKMAKQRRESITLYEQGGRQELADIEKAELAVIEEFLPARLSEDDVRAIIVALIAETGAAGMKDMGKVVGALKARHGTEVDMAAASALVKAALSA